MFPFVPALYIRTFAGISEVYWILLRMNRRIEIGAQYQNFDVIFEIGLFSGGPRFKKPTSMWPKTLYPNCWSCFRSRNAPLFAVIWFIVWYYHCNEGNGFCSPKAEILCRSGEYFIDTRIVSSIWISSLSCGYQSIFLWKQLKVLKSFPWDEKHYQLQHWNLISAWLVRTAASKSSVIIDFILQL